MPGGQINDPSTVKYFSLLFLPPMPLSPWRAFLADTAPFKGPRQRQESGSEEWNRIVFPQRGVIDLPSRQINDFLPKRKQKNIELVARPSSCMRTILFNCTFPYFRSISRVYVNGKDVSSTSSIAAGAASPVLPVPGGGIGTIVGLGQLDLHHRSGTPNSGWKSSSSTTGSPVPSNDGNNQPDASGWVFQLKTHIFANLKHSLYLRLTDWTYFHQLDFSFFPLNCESFLFCTGLWFVR